MSENSILILLCAAFALTAIGLLIGCISSFLKASAFLRRALLTDGVVVQNALAKNSDDGETYLPVVLFATQNGQRTLTGKTATNPPVYSVGERVGVCFAPENPNDARIYSLWEIYHNAWLFLLFDAAAFITAFVLYYAAHH
jgi:hypothetical protein